MGAVPRPESHERRRTPRDDARHVGGPRRTRRGRLPARWRLGRGDGLSFSRPLPESPRVSDKRPPHHARLSPTEGFTARDRIRDRLDGRRAMRSLAAGAGSSARPHRTGARSVHPADQPVCSMIGSVRLGEMLFRGRHTYNQPNHRRPPPRGGSRSKPRAWREVPPAWRRRG